MIDDEIETDLNALKITSSLAIQNIKILRLRPELKKNFIVKSVSRF